MINQINGLRGSLREFKSPPGHQFARATKPFKTLRTSLFLGGFALLRNFVTRPHAASDRPQNWTSTGRAWGLV